MDKISIYIMYQAINLPSSCFWILIINHRVYYKLGFLSFGSLIILKDCFLEFTNCILRNFMIFLEFKFRKNIQNI